MTWYNNQQVMSRQNRLDRSAKDKQYLLQIGDNIRTIRKQRGYSQEEFADIAGFSRSYYTEIETGKRNISVLNLIKIMEALNVEPKEIIGSFKPK
ncbi:helix-turn-helix domain-containing protein [Chloroflexota bacterium]